MTAIFEQRMINHRIINRTRRLLVIAMLVCSFVSPDSFAAEKIRIFYSAITGEQSAFYIVKESGMFQKYGLEPEIIYLDSGTIAVQAMLSGEIQLGLLGSTAAISSSLRGSDIKIIAGDTPPKVFDKPQAGWSPEGDG